VSAKIEAGKKQDGVGKSKRVFVRVALVDFMSKSSRVLSSNQSNSSCLDLAKPAPVGTKSTKSTAARLLRWSSYNVLIPIVNLLQREEKRLSSSERTHTHTRKKISTVRSCLPASWGIAPFILVVEEAVGVSSLYQKL